ncbi:MAG: sensor histidine kinase [Nonomuraea sp.]|nr:sensor histidine kinase [Nonomuraea sp.]
MDPLERRMLPLVSVGPYVLLAGLAAYTIATKHADPRTLIADLALCTLAAAWMLVLFTLRPDWRARPRVMALFLAGLIVIMLVLALRDPWFGLFVPAAYLYAFRLLPWPLRLAGIAGVAVVAGTAQAAGMSKTSLVDLLALMGVVVANAVPMCLLAYVVRRMDQQHDEVQQANRRLAAMQRQLIGQAREAGVADERQRMAREIHDTLAQGLTGIITQLQAAEQADDDPERRGRHVRAAIGLARESLTEARRSVLALRPSPLEEARLGDALAAVAGRWETLHGVAVRVATTGEARPLPPDVEDALLRTAQEALANVAKHARAGRVGLTLTYMDRQVVLDVRDDGRGFDPLRGRDPGAVDEQAGGFGLIGMRERMERVSGTFSVESEPGLGTAISAVVDL